MVHVLIWALAPMAAGCGAYDPPPELVAVNLPRGTYDPTRGDIALTFSEPVDPETLAVDVLTARFNVERDLCAPGGASGDLPAGCARAAEVVIAADSDKISLDAARTEVRIDGAGLETFSKYVVRVRGGLADDAGRVRRPPVLLPFYVQAPVEGTPTTVESGVFFGRLTTTSPLEIKVTMFFFAQVDPAQGRLKMFGCDADPAKGGPDSGEPSLRQDAWKADPAPPMGFTAVARGVIQETPTETRMELFPFDLVVTTPPVTAGGAVFRGSIAPGEPPGDVGGTRQLIAGQLDAESILLGGAPLEGDAQGDLVLFRLTEDEAPPLSSLLGEGVTEEDVRSTFDE